MSSVNFLLASGSTGTFGVDYDVDDVGKLHILDKDRHDRTARDIMCVAPGEWVWVKVDGLGS